MSPDESVLCPLPPNSGESSVMDKTNTTGIPAVPHNSLESTDRQIAPSRRENWQERLPDESQEIATSPDVDDFPKKRIVWWNRLKTRVSHSKFSRSMSAATVRMRSHPLCPSYQKGARFVSIVLATLLFFGVSMSLRPGRAWTRLCAVAILAEAVGMLFHSTTALPSLLGMLLVGAGAGHLGFITPKPSPQFHIVRATALVVLLIRTGFRLDPQNVRKLSGLLLGLATLPGLAECAVVAVLSHFLIGLTVQWALLLGLVLAAACPSVLRPSFYRMGGGQELDTILLAAAGINDLVAISLLGLDISVVFSEGTVSYQLLHRLIGVAGGILFGGLYGIIARYIPEKNDPQVASLRSTMLVSMGLFAIFGGEYIGLIGGGPIACMVAAIVSSWGWRRQGWTTKYNPVATTFDVFWRVMQPFMFALIGAEADLDTMDSNSYFIGIGILCVAWALRMGVSLLVTWRGNLNLKEKLFISLAWLPKADVQAALGPFALDIARRRNDDEVKKPATICLMFVLMAVILTAPLSAALVGKRGLAPYLLGKTSSQQRQPQTNQSLQTDQSRPTIPASETVIGTS